MSNTITNIGRCNGRRNPPLPPLAVVTVDGIELLLFPWENAQAIAAQVEAVIDEKDTHPGLGLEPDAMPWEAVSELDLMEVDLLALRCGLVRPYAYVDAATAEAIEDEAIGLEFSIQPYNW